MNAPMSVALILVGVLVPLGIGTLVMQIRGFRRLKSGPMMPEDDRRYFRARHRRRMLMSANLLAIAGMLGWTYLSGMEAQADALTKPVAGNPPQNPEGNPPAENLPPVGEAAEPAANPPEAGAAANPVVPRKLTPEQREFVRFYSLYWILTLVLLFLLVSFALFDLLATRTYAMRQLRQMREDHRVILERDLAVYRQQRSDRRRFQMPESPDGPPNGPSMPPSN
ncbi:hypothetical protein [Tuwongella immobilis]|uniref:Transmembrane protein n=1 Tax=Tuwongella immobilis TaxID=692036 RepID=A0A6C2YMK2_9BACT|nr:hypothetical protein [Tuwongella immobilis]VIP02666.1 unnamed protein product [Tuwongella immobilis]VTS02087.1 unnamed protein product [Tuwongella immobilis]